MKTRKKRDKTEAWNNLVADGKNAGRRKDLDLAANKFQEAYDVSRSFPESDPRRGESAYYLAYARYVGQQPEIAIKLFEEALRHMSDPSHTERCRQIHSILGAIYFGLNQLESAERHIRSSIKLEESVKKESWENIQILASILMIQRKYQEAIPLLEKLILVYKMIDPEETIKTLKVLAHANNELGDLEEELNCQKEILKIRESQSFKHSPKIEIPDIVPKGWGLDRITHFVDATRQNEFATFDNKKKLYGAVSDINERFWDSRRNLALHIIEIVEEKYPSKQFEELKLESKDWLELYFFLRAHASLLGAIRMAFSAQCPETYTLLRGSIENAIYAFYISTDDKLKDIWLERHRDKNAYKECRKKFGPTKIFDELAKQDSELANTVSLLYDDTIDQGAHPNVKTFLANAFQENDNGEITLAVAYLNPGGLDDTLKQTILVGKAVLEVFRVVFPNLID